MNKKLFIKLILLIFKVNLVAVSSFVIALEPFVQKSVAQPQPEAPPNTDTTPTPPPNTDTTPTPPPDTTPTPPPETPANPPEIPANSPETPANPPETPANPPETPVNPPEIPVNPPEIPVNPPEIPANPPEIPVNPPEIPVNPPEIPVNPPETPVNPPEIPANPPEIPVNPPETPVNPPEIPVNPPEIPVNPQNTIPIPITPTPNPTPQQTQPQTIPNRNYIGFGGNFGLNGDTALGENAFTLFSKIGISNNLSFRPAAMVSDKAVFLLPVTIDFPIQSSNIFREPKTIAVPYLGGGAAVSTDDDSSVGLLITGGVDIPLSDKFTATAGVNIGFFDETDSGLLLGIGYKF